MAKRKMFILLELTIPFLRWEKVFGPKTLTEIKRERLKRYNKNPFKSWQIVKV